MMLARRIFVQAMIALSAEVGGSDWERPSSVVASPVYKGSNPAELPSKNTPDEKIVHELFIKGTEPTKVHDGADDKPLPAPSGLQARYSASEDTIHIQWSAFKDFDKTTIDPEFVLTINGEEKVIDDTHYEIKHPKPGTYDISLYIRRGEHNQGNPSVLTLTVQEKTKEKKKPSENEEETDEDEDDD